MKKTIEFAIYLTGHDKATIEQMYNDWVKQSPKIYTAEDMDKAYDKGFADGRPNDMDSSIIGCLLKPKQS